MERRPNRRCGSTRPLLLAAALILASAAHAQQWSSWKNRYQNQAPTGTYRLPFASGTRIRVDQGPNGGYSHHDSANRHAIDFALPEGTPVLAAREGVVLQIESGVRENFTQRPAQGGESGNFIRIRHDDGSIAVYAHLRPDGTVVRVGQRVVPGQRIGLSGNTGFSTAPHLHFAVQLDRGHGLESIPVRIVGPLGELKFAGGR